MKIHYKIAILFATIILTSMTQAWADDMEAATPTGFGVGIGTWLNPRFSGIVKGGASGTEISLNNNLGLPRQSMIVPHAWYRWAHGQIFDARYTQYSQVISSGLSVPENYQGASFASGSQITTTMKVQWADLAYELPIAYDEFPPEKSFLNAYLDVRAIRGTFSITDNLGHSGSHQPITVPFPLFGIHGKYQVIRDGSFEFRAAGIRAGFEDAVGWSYDLEAGFNQRLFDKVEIGAKYRYFTFYNRDSNDNRFAFRLYGPEVDVNAHF